ncbi:hypothetical protein J7E62_27720 [Variovorax paradoxus]|nr:hypothetical protein [Variovorax paradoxus]
MTPKKHPSNNKIVRKPEGWDDQGGKLELPAIDITQGRLYGRDVFVSWWKPTEDELMCLIRGGHVQLCCIGGQPAVNISAVDENGTTSGLILPH